MDAKANCCIHFSKQKELPDLLPWSRVAGAAAAAAHLLRTREANFQFHPLSHPLIRPDYIHRPCRLSHPFCRLNDRHSLGKKRENQRDMRERADVTRGSLAHGCRVLVPPDPQASHSPDPQPEPKIISLLLRFPPFSFVSVVGLAQFQFCRNS